MGLLTDMNDELHDEADAASLAFDRSDSYQWCGYDIKWPGQAHWLWIAILRQGNYIGEQVALIMMFIGSRKDIRELERRWHRDSEDVLDELSEFMAQFSDDDPATVEALKVGTMIRDDIEASRNELDSDGEEAEGAPKKSQGELPTSSTFTGRQDSAPMQSDTASPTPKDCNYLTSNSTQPVTSSLAQS